MTTTIHDQWLYSASVEELVGDDTIAMCDKKESVILHSHSTQAGEETGGHAGC